MEGTSCSIYNSHTSSNFPEQGKIASMLVYYSSMLVYYSSMLVYYCSMLVYYSFMLVYYSSIL